MRRVSSIEKTPAGNPRIAEVLINSGVVVFPYGFFGHESGRDFRGYFCQAEIGTGGAGLPVGAAAERAGE